MPWIRTIGMAVLGVATLALSAEAAAFSPASGTSRSTALTHPLTVNLIQPQSLPVGAPPGAAYIGDQSGPIHRPGKPPLPVGPGINEQLLMRARGGYLLTLDSSEVRYVSDTGPRHRVFRVSRPTHHYIANISASRDGRYVAITERSNIDRHHVRVVVRRVSRPLTMAQRTFSIPVVVASLTGRRALLTTDVIPLRQRPVLLTRWWNLHTGRLRVIDNGGQPGPGFDLGRQSAADLTAGQVALVRGSHDHVVTLRHHPHRVWNTNAHEWVLSWSPDDRYVLTASWTPQRPRWGDGWDTIAVRRARDGKLITQFAGYENLKGSQWTPIWEHNTTFVAYASGTCDHDSCANYTSVRCTIHGPCEQLPLPDGMYSISERRLPPS